MLDSERYQLWCGDCLDLMGKIPDGSIDFILCDIPFGTTQCKWDVIIPFDPLWGHYERIIKPNGAIALFSAQPFVSRLVTSRIEFYKYSWYWHKNFASGFQLAKIQPTRAIEEICIFYREQPTYNRQPTKSIISDRVRKVGASNGGTVSMGKNDHQLGTKPLRRTFGEDVAPRNLLEIPCVTRREMIHPTQKPVELMEYFIKTYTNTSDIVLDNCFGSCSAGIACLNTRRRFLGIEKDPGYFATGRQRMSDHSDIPSLFDLMTTEDGDDSWDV